jgi:peptide deformylase
MAILEILEFPDPRLRTIAKPVNDINDDIRTLAEDMLETMYAAPGVGLAATQVNHHKRLVVIDVSEEKNQPLVFINPQITTLPGGTVDYDEGCLSVPGFYESVTRAENILVKALDIKGEAFELSPQGLLAVCIQHEVDHLNGKLFVDYISALKRQRIRKKLIKQHHQKVG